MRLIITAIVVFAFGCGGPNADAGRFASIISAAFDATSPTPTPTPESDVCDNCDGTGRVGDGTIEKVCPVCKGTGKKPVSDAGAQATPWPGVAAMLQQLNPQPHEVLLDPGCGSEARLLIAAVNYFELEHAIGIEIDPTAAEAARREVAAAGLADRIEIISGDSTQLDVDADVAMMYMWPEVLGKLRPKLERLDRFVCYGFAVPGMPMKHVKAANGGDLYVWKKATPIIQAPLTRTVRVTVSIPRGSYCEVCHRRCNNPMAHVLQTQVIQPAPKYAVRYEARQVKKCRNGVCYYVTEYVPVKYQIQ